jgi:hypothetical protein
MKKPANLQKKGLKELISNLILQETQIKVALSGVNLKEPISAVFASFPPLGPATNILLHKHDRNPKFSCNLTLINSVLLTFSSDEHIVTIILPNNIHKIRRGKLSVRIPSALP